MRIGEANEALGAVASQPRDKGARERKGNFLAVRLQFRVLSE